MSNSEPLGSRESQLPPPPSAVPVPTRTGALSYGLGFLAFIPIPLFSLVIAGVVMRSTRPSGSWEVSPPRTRAAPPTGG